MKPRLTMSLGLVLLFSSFCYSQKYSLEFANMKCNKTTEMGEDEVYFVLTEVKSSYGLKKQKIFSKRLPGNNQHWNLNDGSHQNTILNGFSFGDFSLSSGDEITFLLTIMEEDGGIPSNYLDTIATALAATGEPDATAAAGVARTISGVLRILKIQDTDDFIGALMITISKPFNMDSDMPVSIKYTPVDRVFAIGDDGASKAVNFRGDGSDYTAWFRVDKK